VTQQQRTKELVGQNSNNLLMIRKLCSEIQEEINSLLSVFGFSVKSN